LGIRDFGQIAPNIENVAEEFMARQSILVGAQALDVPAARGISRSSWRRSDRP